MRRNLASGAPDSSYFELRRVVPFLELGLFNVIVALRDVIEEIIDLLVSLFLIRFLMLAKAPLAECEIHRSLIFTFSRECERILSFFKTICTRRTLLPTVGHSAGERLVFGFSSVFTASASVSSAFTSFALHSWAFRGFQATQPQLSLTKTFFETPRTFALQPLLKCSWCRIQLHFRTCRGAKVRGILKKKTILEALVSFFA